MAEGTANPARAAIATAVAFTADGAMLDGDWTVPVNARAAVLFAHGSGSSRHSPRNQAVAAALQDAGLATLLLDLLTPEEERVDLVTREFRFDIPLLATRLVGAIDWLNGSGMVGRGQIGIFGASTGAGAALIAAADRPEAVGAVVSRGGRPDLAGSALPHVLAPTLLIVGGEDTQVIDLNRQAMARLSCPAHLAIVPGATHLFEEQGALEQVARLARDWFLDHLTDHADSQPG